MGLKTVVAQGRTVVMTSHDLARAEDPCNPVRSSFTRVVATSATRKDLRKTNLLTFYKQALAA